MTGTYLKPIEITPVALLVAGLPDHRIYYTCKEKDDLSNPKKHFICERGLNFSNPLYLHQYICAFATTPDKYDSHFEKKYPETRVVKSISGS